MIILEIIAKNKIRNASVQIYQTVRIVKSARKPVDVSVSTELTLLKRELN